ncbi:MAG: TIGR02757 family protein [Bacteroidota bacterium]
MSASVRTILDEAVQRYERTAFIADDPISIPHAFDDPLDREIIGLYAALLAWGRRATILNKLADLCERMQYRPGAFVRDFEPERDAHRLAGFKHRTFQPADAVWLTKALSLVLHRHGSLNQLFLAHHRSDAEDVQAGLEGFSNELLTIVPETPARVKKHVARPSTKSACKRLNMYLRWMVRPGPVDFEQWTGVHLRQLVLPLDVHSGTQARQLGLLTRKQNDWRAAAELTDSCRLLNPNDPARYDFALFGLGAYSGEAI